MVGWFGSDALTAALADAPCGCELDDTAAPMTDERGAKVLRADAVVARDAWRCPRAGGAIDPSALDEAHCDALRKARALTGCDASDLRTCPGFYARTPQAHEVVKLLRWQKAGQLQLRCPHPTGVVVDALDEVSSAIAARERDDMERLRREHENGALKSG